MLLENDPGLADGKFVYLLGVFFGSIGAILSLALAHRRGDDLVIHGWRRIVTISALGTAAAMGGMLGILLFGPVIQICWSNIAGWLSESPGASTDVLWPYPVSLWYWAGNLGSMMGGLVATHFVLRIAKHMTEKPKRE